MVTCRSTVSGRWMIACLLLPGCGTTDRLWPVAGTVAFADGRPLAGGVIELKPVANVGRSARGAVGADGRFSLDTAGRRGVGAGRYRVAIVPQLVVGHAPHGPGVAPRFTRFETSGLEVEIPSGGIADLTLTIESGR